MNRTILSLLFTLTALIAPAASARAEDERVRITFWHSDTYEANRAVWQRLADGFIEEHPGVRIKIVVLEYEAYRPKLIIVII
jgi:ABC-type glycerol-3-phosphate transport system substrate-binding protein